MGQTGSKRVKQLQRQAAREIGSKRDKQRKTENKRGGRYWRYAVKEIGNKRQESERKKYRQFRH